MLFCLHLQVTAKSNNQIENIDLRLVKANNTQKKFGQTVISAIIKGHTVNENQNPFFVRVVYRHPQIWWKICIYHIIK